MKYVVYRTIQALMVVVLITIACFFMLRASAGDPARLQGQVFTQEDVLDQYRAEFGTDKSLLEQFVSFADDLVHGTLGTSFRYRVPVEELLAKAIPATLLLASSSLLLALTVVILLGVAAARNPGGRADQFATGLTVFGQSAPLFWVGLLLIAVFAVLLHWLPAGGFRSWSSLILPSIAIALAIIPTQLRVFTTSMRAELSEDYIRTGHAFGVSERRITYRYALRNAVLPLMTVVGTDMGYLLGGAIVAEVVFNFPGLGSLAITALNARDYPLLQGITIVAAAMFVFLNLAVDLLYVVVNPRIRLGS